MPCNCNSEHCDECMTGWTPLPPAEKGSDRWKDEMAFKFCNEKYLLEDNMIVKLPKVDNINLGYMAIFYRPGSGTSYFRVDEIKCYNKKIKECYG